MSMEGLPKISDVCSTSLNTKSMHIFASDRVTNRPPLIELSSTLVVSLNTYPSLTLLLTLQSLNHGINSCMFP